MGYEPWVLSQKGGSGMELGKHLPVLSLVLLTPLPRCLCAPSGQWLQLQQWGRQNSSTDAWAEARGSLLQGGVTSLFATENQCSNGCLTYLSVGKKRRWYLIPCSREPLVTAPVLCTTTAQSTALASYTSETKNTEWTNHFRVGREMPRFWVSTGLRYELEVSFYERAAQFCQEWENSGWVHLHIQLVRHNTLQHS